MLAATETAPAATSAHFAYRIARLILLTEPPGLDAGEITDKGYINQRQVLANRPELVGLLYQDPPPDAVIMASSTAGVRR